MHGIISRRIAHTARPRRVVGLLLLARGLASTSTLYTPSPTALKNPRSIAVLGGGLTGLTTALYLSRFLPTAKITIYEATDRLGGWIETKDVDIDLPGGERGTVMFEQGARMIQVPRQGTPKWDDMVFFELVAILQLRDELAEAARAVPMKQFIYYPDHIEEIPQPKSLAEKLKLYFKVLTNPLFKGVREAVSRVQANRLLYALDLQDPRMQDPEFLKSLQVRAPKRDRMSLGQYYEEATKQPQLVQNMVSAMIHGIWGGDVWKLSDERDPFGHYFDRPFLGPSCKWTVLSNEETDLLAMMPQQGEKLDLEVNRMSHVWFLDGFQTLTKAMETVLRSNPNVTIKTGEPVDSIRNHATNTLAITSKGIKKPVLYDKVVSTIFSKTLASLADGKLPSLAATHAVTIRVVNLYYPNPKPKNPRHTGLGYLIPQSVKQELNPECALGVLFDSDREDIAPSAASWLPGTKLTVLLGGHYWDDLPAEFLPDDAQAIEMAKAVVARHLGVTKEDNDSAVAHTKLCRDCIPQHYVGHWARMAEARVELLTAFHGRLAVAGPSYQMPGVLGSIRAARDVATWISGRYPAELAREMFPVGDTGLDRFAFERKWFPVRKETLPLRFPWEHLGFPEPKRSLLEKLGNQARGLATAIWMRRSLTKYMREAEEREKNKRR